MVRKKILISGRVQGVGFRMFTVRQARNFGIKGYAKNLFNGKVEVLAIGEKNELNPFIEQLKIGPRMANVKKLNVNETDNDEEFEDFSIRY